MQFTWQPQVKFLLLVCAVLPLTISAIFWQLDRAEQKRTALAQQDRGAALPAIDLHRLQPEALQNYTKVYVDGHWSEAVFLLDNRIRSGRVGYEVVGILQSASGQLILVNRGWVAGGQDRSFIPQIDIPFGDHRIDGYLYRSAQKPMVLAEQVWSHAWPEKLQAIDFDLLEARIGAEFFPSVLRISAESPLAYQADWRLERDGPEMHIGYAVQWFLMSLTVVIMTLFASSNLWDWIKYKRTQQP